MTPEQIAEFLIIKSVIAKVIREAIATEREACAKIADIWANTKPVSGPVANIIATAQSEAAFQIAQGIRSRP